MYNGGSGKWRSKKWDSEITKIFFLLPWLFGADRRPSFVEAVTSGYNSRSGVDKRRKKNRRRWWTADKELRWIRAGGDKGHARKNVPLESVMRGEKSISRSIPIASVLVLHYTCGMHSGNSRVHSCMEHPLCIPGTTWKYNRRGSDTYGFHSVLCRSYTWPHKFMYTDSGSDGVRGILHTVQRQISVMHNFFSIRQPSRHTNREIFGRYCENKNWGAKSVVCIL